MPPDDLLVATVKLALACLLGGVVGWQREAHDRPAGFRTHILVCVGSCLVMIVSTGAAGARYDPGRIAAQVVSGIGFLGAGTILRQGSIVRGLTTAASLWTVAGIGLAVGLGGNYAAIGTIATILVLATLTVMSRVERHLMAHRDPRDLRVVLPREQMAGVVRFFGERNVTIRSIETEHTDERGMRRLRLTLLLPPHLDVGPLTHELLTVLAAHDIEWE